jgi:hypothetical protein
MLSSNYGVSERNRSQQRRHGATHARYQRIERIDGSDHIAPLSHLLA